MDLPQASRFADDHDVVLVGYRGVDGSARLDCPEVDSALKHSTDLLGEDSYRGYADGYRACADRLTDDGVDLAGYGLVQQVDDLEAARVALGYERIDLLSESAGTRTAMIYSWRHPASIHRSVMIGVNPATSCGTRRRPTSRSAATPSCAPRTPPAGSGPTTSPLRCGELPPICPTAGSSCKSTRAT